MGFIDGVLCMVTSALRGVWAGEPENALIKKALLLVQASNKEHE